MKAHYDIMKPVTDHTEARLFEQSAARGVRDVVMVWLLRRLVVPLAFLLLGVIAVTYHTNGLFAAVPAVIVTIIYLGWIIRFYRRNFLRNVPFRREYLRDRLDEQR